MRAAFNLALECGSGSRALQAWGAGRWAARRRRGIMGIPMATLFEKVWNAHAVRTLPSGQTQLFVGLHLVHEVTSPQAFDMLRQHGWGVPFPERTFATVDHIVPTSSQSRPFLDVAAEEMTTALERSCREFGIQLWAPGGPGGENQG